MPPSTASPSPAPRCLDLFCCAGGSARGLQLAGYHVTGVDINPQPRYCGDAFYQADAMTFPLEGFDFIWASPPCQGYSGHVTSRSSKHAGTLGKDEPRLISRTRERLQQTGKPYAIENVVGAASEMHSPILLCGVMFGLPIARHRLIETWPHRPMILHPDCRGVAKRFSISRGWDYRDMTVTGKGRRAGTSDRWREILGVTWQMSQAELREAIPPAYSRYIGEQFMPVVLRAMEQRGAA